LKRPFLLFFPAIGWIILSTVLLTLPGSVFPKENWLDLIWFDKWVHIGMFAIMAFLWCWGIYKKGTNRKNRLLSFILSGIICLAYGIVMEFVQKNYIPNRSFDVGDIIADGVGSLAGIIFSARVYIKK
jgi:VanZ family protein